MFFLKIFFVFHVYLAVKSSIILYVLGKLNDHIDLFSI
jgi:hypothetical protein